MSLERRPLDYHAPQMKTTVSGRWSGLAVLALAWSILSTPCLVAWLTPQRYFDGLTPEGRETAARVSLFVPPLAGMLLAAVAAIRIARSRGRLRGMAWAAVGGGLSLLWLALACALISMLSGWKGD